MQHKQTRSDKIGIGSANHNKNSKTRPPYYSYSKTNRWHYKHRSRMVAPKQLCHAFVFYMILTNQVHRYISSNMYVCDCERTCICSAGRHFRGSQWITNSRIYSYWDHARGWVLRVVHKFRSTRSFISVVRGRPSTISPRWRQIAWWSISCAYSEFRQKAIIGLEGKF